MTRRTRPLPSVATHFPSLSLSADIGLDTHMFIEDVHLAVMPIGGRRTARNKTFAVVLDGKEAEPERARQVFATLAHYRQHSPEELLSDMINNIAQYLAWDGEVVFEIISGRDGQPFVLSNFPTKRLLRLPGCYIQFVPIRDWKFVGKRLVLISSRRVWRITMPVELGGRGGYRKILARLKRSKSLAPEFSTDDLKRGKPDKDFSVQDYVRNARIYSMRATRSWGWNRRDGSDEWWTEFFGAYRTIKFRLAQARLREHILAEVNRLMERLEIGCEVRVDGLPTAKDILDVMHSLQEGFISFSDAYDRTSV